MAKKKQVYWTTKDLQKVVASRRGGFAIWTAGALLLGLFVGRRVARS